MSISSEKGKSLENLVATTLRKKLGARVERDKRSGAGSHQKMDISNYFGDVPLSIEVKNHKTIKIREWWKQAVGGSSPREVPTVVFQTDDDVLATLRFSDLVNLLAEINQGTAVIADLRKPVAVAGLEDVVAVKATKGAQACRNGHLLGPNQTKCFAKGCPYSAGYRVKKPKK